MKKSFFLFIFLVSLEMQGCLSYLTIGTDRFLFRHTSYSAALYKKFLLKNNPSLIKSEIANKFLHAGAILAISSSIMLLRDLTRKFFFGTGLSVEKRDFWMAIMRAYSESYYYYDITTLAKWRFLYLNRPDGINIINNLMHSEFKKKVSQYTPNFLELEKEREKELMKGSISGMERTLESSFINQSLLSEQITQLRRERDASRSLLKPLQDELESNKQELNSLKGELNSLHFEFSNVAVVEKEQLIGKIQKLENRVRRLQNNLVGFAEKDKRGEALLEQLKKLQQEERLKRSELQQESEAELEKCITHSAQ